MYKKKKRFSARTLRSRYYRSYPNFSSFYPAYLDLKRSEAAVEKLLKKC